MNYTNKLLIVLAVILVLTGYGLEAERAKDLPVDDVVVEAESSQVATSTMAEVAYVIDGDTVELASGKRVRLLGIDTPEMEECYYQEATEFARSLMTGQSVRLVPDVTDEDKYGRLLRHVFVTDEVSGEEVHMNYELLQGGYAEILPIPPDRDYRAEFRQAERLAKESEVGLWGVCE